MLDGILWVLHTGAQWREMPERYGPWKTVYGRFRRWRREGLFDRLLSRRQARLDRRGRIDWDLFCVDGTSVRVSRSAAGAKGGAVRESPRTTRRVAREAAGAASPTWSLTIAGFPWPSPSPRARRTRASRVEPVVRAVRVGRRRRPRKLAGDKGYSHELVRRWLWGRGIRPVVPCKADRLGKRGRPARSDRRAYRRRDVVERCVNWLKENRRPGTRHDKLAASSLAWATLAMIRRCFRVLRL